MDGFEFGAGFLKMNRFMGVKFSRFFSFRRRPGNCSQRFSRLEVQIMKYCNYSDPESLYIDLANQRCKGF